MALLRGGHEWGHGCGYRGRICLRQLGILGQFYLVRSHLDGVSCFLSGTGKNLSVISGARFAQQNGSQPSFSLQIGKNRKQGRTCDYPASGQEGALEYTVGFHSPNDRSSRNLQPLNLRGFSLCCHWLLY